MKIILCFVFCFFVLAGCNFESDNAIVTYGYEKKSDCNDKDCHLFNAAKIILYVNPEHQEVTFKLIQHSQNLKDVRLTSFESLKNCKVVSKKDFKCDELESDEGTIFSSTSMLRQLRAKYDLEPKLATKDDAFSKYEVINGSEVVYYASKLVSLSKENIETIDNYGTYILIFLFLGLTGVNQIGREV